MKKFFMFAAMASVALASCTKNEPAASVEQGEAIVFNSPVVAPVTKATSALETLHQNFGAYAYYSTVDYTGTNEVCYLSNREFTPNKTGETVNYWGTTNAYWPKNGKLTFVAYAPKSGVNVPTPDAEETDAAKLTLNYTVPNAIASQVDVLYSAWVADKTSEDQASNDYNATGIEIPFHHALSAVKFQVKAASTAVAPFMKIKGITLSGVKNSGTLTVPYGDDPAWDDQNGTATYTVLAAATDVTSSIGFDDVAAVDLNSGTQFILLPQEGTANLNIEYFIKADDGSWLLQSTGETPISLPMDWEIGTRYTYTLVFNLDEIKLAPVVEEGWADVTPDAVNGVL